MTANRYKQPSQKRTVENHADRLEVVEFGVPIPMWRGLQTFAESQTIPNNNDQAVLWDVTENGDPRFFDEQLSGGKVVSVGLLVRGRYTITVHLEWQSMADLVVQALAIDDGWENPDTHYETPAGIITNADSLNKTITRAYPAILGVPTGTFFGEIQARVAHLAGGPEDLLGDNCYMEISYDGPITISTESYV